MDNRSDIWRGVDAIKPRFIALSDKIWAMPEVCYTEARSAAEHLAELRHQGFRITENVAAIPKAVMGSAILRSQRDSARGSSTRSPYFATMDEALRSDSLISIGISCQKPPLSMLPSRVRPLTIRTSLALRC
jgi:hypothetical protein